jgi:2-oxoglutarate/2-oxoacid ferredoxin oxidoreductase subunit beta
LLYVDTASDDMHASLRTVDAPLNTLSDPELVPGNAALAAINASLR